MAQSLLRQRTVLFGMIAVMGVLALILVWPFLMPILSAVALVVILKPVYGWFARRRWARGKEGRAAGATIVVFLLVIAIPIAFFVGGAIGQARNLGAQIQSLEISPSDLADVLDQAGFAGAAEETSSAIASWLSGAIVAFGKSLPAAFTSLVVMLVIMFVLLPRYSRPERDEVLDIVPFPPEITQLFLDKAAMMITAMFRGTFVIAIVSGLAMGLVLWIAGVPYVSLLTIVSMFLALIPMVGISLVAWPVGILLILNGNVWQGAFVILAFVLVVANIDNVLRPALVPKGAHLNLALVILSVLGGMSLMGFIGVLYGPVIMILLVTSIEVYAKYMLRSDLETLQAQGRIDLKALGLEAIDEGEEWKPGKMVVTAVKNASARLRRESAKEQKVETSQE
ncbi:MAG TPA: AI-2E family transporter [Anaerolineales bacterium]|nr:AI-2E family transporter [Anaerolineales bacterium]